LAFRAVGLAFPVFDVAVCGWVGGSRGRVGRSVSGVAGGLELASWAVELAMWAVELAFLVFDLGRRGGLAVCAFEMAVR
jgi:hypothetical protein